MLIEGQTLLCQKFGNNKGSLFNVTVGKVGRKWAALLQDNREICRIDKITLAIDSGGYTSRYRIWLSQESYEENVTKHVLWRQLRARVDRYSPPETITVAQIKAALIALG